MKKRILVVDDEPVLTHLLKHCLEREGYYEVFEENDASLVIETAAEFGPDLIVLDIMMPQLDGTEVAGRLREHISLSQVPIIFLTALVLGDEAPLGSCKRGGQTFLPKMTPVDRLISCIDQMIRPPADAVLKEESSPAYGLAIA